MVLSFTNPKTMWSFSCAVCLICATASFIPQHCALCPKPVAVIAQICQRPISPVIFLTFAKA